MNRILNSALMLVLIAFCATGIALADKNFKAGLEIGYFIPSDEDFSDIYGGNVIFGVNLAYLLSPNLQLEFAGDIYSAEGKTEITEQTVELDLIKARLGGFYIFNVEGIKPKAGAGFAYCSVDETTPFGDFSDSGIGWFIGAGADMELADMLSAGLEIIYSDVNIEGDFGDQSTGGIAILINFTIML
jgi:opacity protein-like surface antigen